MAVRGRGLGQALVEPGEPRLSTYDTAKLNGYTGTQTEFDTRLVELVTNPAAAGGNRFFVVAQSNGFTGTEDDYYAEMAERMLGNAPADNAALGIKEVNGNYATTLGDGSRTVLIA